MGARVSFKASIQTYAIAQAILYLIRDSEKKELLDEIVVKIEEVSSKQLGHYSESVQKEIVEKVLIPLAKRLMSDTKEGRLAYHATIAREFQASDQRLRAESAIKPSVL